MYRLQIQEIFLYNHAYIRSSYFELNILVSTNQFRWRLVALLCVWTYLSLFNTCVKSLHLIRAETVHKVILLPTGHQDWHLCDTGCLCGEKTFRFTLCNDPHWYYSAVSLYFHTLHTLHCWAVMLISALWTQCTKSIKAGSCYSCPLPWSAGFTSHPFPLGPPSLLAHYQLYIVT